MLWALTFAFAGYGDAVDGFPNWEDRDVHLWTNAARVAPTEFAEDYDCSMSTFGGTETQSQMPLAWNHGLNEAARVHSKDMATFNFVSHDSSDGTRTAARVRRYYQGNGVGENVAGGYSGGFDVVIRGWMCSSGHRVNIMRPEFSELGASGVGAYYTQVFGSSGLIEPLSMGVHYPKEPVSSATFRVVVGSQSRAEDVTVLVDGRSHAMALEYGDDRRGVWSVDVPADGECHQYWFEGTVQGEPQRFPAEGAYGWGDCAYDDEDAQWFDAGSVISEREFAWEEESGCATAPGAGWLALLFTPLWFRRRETPTT